MQTIKKINGINGGNPCRCFWEIPNRQSVIEETSCSTLSLHLISAEQRVCNNICCKDYDASPQLRKMLPIQLYYGYNGRVYSCEKNKEIGYTTQEIFF